MALTLFSSAVVAVVAAAGLTALRMPPIMTCPHSIQYTATDSFKRYVFIGDIHGTSNGLREILDAAGVLEKELYETVEVGDNEEIMSRQHQFQTESPSPISHSSINCRRSQSALSMETVVVQLGDIVDRGRNASLAWDCLDELQNTSPAGSMIRLVGNHEISWVQGNYRGSRDPPEYRRALTSRIRSAILSRRVVGALSLFDGQVLVTHAGLRQAMYDYMVASEFHIDDDASDSSKGVESNQYAPSSDTPIGDTIAKTIENKLINAVAACPEKHSLVTSSFYRPVCPALGNPIFAAGPERGGSGVGGPFWTDFSVISKIDKEDEVSKMIQIVGHSAATCDVSADSKCQPIRSTPYAIAADAAIYWGNRAYLEILVHDTKQDSNTKSVTFVSHTKQSDGFWLARNLTRGRKCGRPLMRQKDPDSMPWSKARRAVKRFMNNRQATETTTP